MTNKKKEVRTIEALDGWVFWYDCDEEMWKAAIKEDYVKHANNPKVKVPALAATNLSDLMMYLTTGLDDIN